MFSTLNAFLWAQPFDPSAAGAVPPRSDLSPPEDMNNSDNLKRAELDLDPDHPPLIPSHVAEQFAERWMQVQAAFVDDPRAAVQHADELVALAIARLAESFAEERSALESQWTGGGSVSTEDLRRAMQRYRTFFQRLLHL
jgi:hypothetical protein